MAARSDDPDVSPESSSPAAAAAGGEIWGTLEELLLACAVRRHGTASWDSVAVEVQSRSSHSAAARLTPNGCRLRYGLLHRRFAAGADEDGEPGADADAWVEELRKLRVAELRREVERYDLSIGSLKSKVKRLKEERERSLSGEEATPAASKEERETGNESTEEVDGENRVSGEAASPPGHDSGGAADDGKPEVKEEPDAGVVAVKEESSGESVAGSKEADAEKENSDVQSAASPLRRRRRRLRKVGGDGLAELCTSAPLPLPAAEMEPLLAFLESVRTSKSGSVFERRLESQESGEYTGIIRRHVDLEMIRSRLESGGAAGGPGSVCYASASEFYRDLLLLCANALVFFPRGSREHAAAARTRALVSKRISASLHRGGGIGTSGKDAAVPVVGGGSSADGAKKPKDDAEIAGSLLEKAAPIIVCRKRSSIAKAAAAAAGKDEKVEKGDTDEEEDGDEGKKKKGDAKDKARGLRTNKSQGPVKNSAPNQKTVKVPQSAVAAAEGMKKSDKKGGSGGKAPAAAGGVIKKRNAVDFLKRMKQDSSPSTERVSLLETLKLSAATEQKKAGKGDGRKEPGSSSGSKKAAAATDTGSGGRRGRPPKRATAPPTPPPAKRAKDDRPTRKRGKK